MHVPAPVSSRRAVGPSSSPVAAPGALAPIEARVRFVETAERADLAFVGPKGEIRVRLTFQPTNGRVNVKSLSGFVRREGARPSAALLVEEDSAFELVGGDQTVQLTASLSFGQRTAEGTVFLVDGQPVLVPSTRASQAVALFVADTREVVVLARK
jgi:cell pole-organizing protein PopZ